MVLGPNTLTLRDTILSELRQQIQASIDQIEDTALASAIIAAIDAASTVATATAEDAVNAKVAGLRIVTGGVLLEPGMAAALVDSNNNMAPAWILATDGNLHQITIDAYVESLWEQIGGRLGIAFFDPSVNDFHWALVDERGYSSYVQGDEYGLPTDYTRAVLGGLPKGGTHGWKLVKQGADDFAATWTPDSGGGGGSGLSTISRQTAYGAQRAYPQVFKPLSAPILAFEDQSASTTYWPQLIDLTASATWTDGDWKVGLIYSSDHAYGEDGLYLAVAMSPEGPFTDLGLMWEDTFLGNSTETPSVTFNDDTGLYHVYYQQTGAGFGVQNTMLMTTPNIVDGPYTRVGHVLAAYTREQGDGHVGYARPYRWAGQWYAYSLCSGGGVARNAFWTSPDGIDWTESIHKVGYEQHLIDHLTGWSNDWIFKYTTGAIIEHRGQPWIITMASAAASGGGGGAVGRIVTAPLAANLRNLAARPIDITPAAQGWEGDGITWIGNAMEFEGDQYIPYKDASDEADFGLLRIA